MLLPAVYEDISKASLVNKGFPLKWKPFELSLDEKQSPPLKAYFM